MNRTLLTIRFSKKSDGTSVMACTRPDGSVTWQRHRHGFFPLHDITHFVLETTLGLRYGFYGLLSDGWNITDFGERSIPEFVQMEAALAEATAGLLDQERGTGVVPEADAFNEALGAVMREMEQPFERRIRQDELDTIRRRFMEFAGRWTQTPVGEPRELAFEIPAV